MDVNEFLRQSSKVVDFEIRKVLPKRVSAEWLRENVGVPDHDVRSVNEFFAKPLWDILSRGGKRWRPALMLLSCGAVGGKPDRVKKYSVIPELIHNGTLMADDIEDDSKKRRGKDAIHRIYGTDVAVNLSSMLYYFPLLMIKSGSLDKDVKLKLYELINHEMLSLHFGQGTDIIWHKGLFKVTEKQYFAMCRNKTGTLARLSAKMGAILGKAESLQVDELGRFAERLGVAFQIQDDVLNLAGALGKSVGDDVTEGKISLPVIRTLQTADKDDARVLKRILCKHTRDRKEIITAINVMKRCDSISYSREVSEDVANAAWDGVRSVLPPTKYRRMLQELARFVVMRKS